MADDKKFTLDDILGSSDDEREIEIKVMEGDLEALMLFCSKMNGMISTVFHDREEEYRFMRGLCLIDIALHKFGTGGCEVGSPGCGLLNTLKVFKSRFADQLKEDPKYTVADFEWKFEDGSKI